MLGLKAWTTLEVTMASTDPMPTVGLCGLLDSLTCGGILCSHEALFLKLGLFNFFGNDIDVGWSEDELAELRAEIVNLGGSRSVTDEWVLSACRQEARGRLEANVRSVFAWRDDESIVRLVRGAMTVFGWREVGFGRFFRKSIDERNFETSRRVEALRRSSFVLTIFGLCALRRSEVVVHAATIDTVARPLLESFDAMRAISA